MKYYPHYCGAFDDEKIQLLYMEFGYEGLGLFYTTLEKLAAQEKPVKTVVLKKQLRVGKRLDKCWCFMEKIEIISSNNGETFSKKLANYTESLNEKRKKTLERVLQLREKQKDAKTVTHYTSDCNASNIKNNITEHNINNNTNNDADRVGGSSARKSTKFDANKMDLPFNGQFRETWTEWVEYRSKSKKSLTEISAKKQLELVACFPEETAVAMLVQSITNGWQGIFEVKKSTNSPPGQGKIVESAIAIRQASQNLLDKGLVRTYDQYLEDEENFSI
jgi:hypothetical protein